MAFWWGILGSGLSAFDHEGTERCSSVALRLLRGGDAAESLYWFNKAIRSAPGRAELYLGRSEAWQKVGDDQLAVADASLGVVLQPRLSEGYARLATVLFAQGSLSQAGRAAFLGTQCGDPNGRQGPIGRLLSRMQQSGYVSLFVWTPLNRWPRTTWALLSVKDMALGIMAQLVETIVPGGSAIFLGIFASPWPLFPGRARLLVLRRPGRTMPSLHAAPIATGNSSYMDWYRT